MVFTATQQLDFLAQFLPFNSQPIILVSSQDYLGIFERSSPDKLQTERWLLLEKSCFYSLIKFRGMRKFIKDYLCSKELLYDLENRVYEAENFAETSPDELVQLHERLEGQENWNELLFQLLLSHSQTGLISDLVSVFEQLSYCSSSTSEHFNFARHPYFDWPALACEYIFDSSRVYGTSLPDLFASELTPSLAQAEQQFGQALSSSFFNLDWTYQSVNGWKYAILGRCTVYQLSSDFADPLLSSTAPICQPTLSSPTSLTSLELRQCRTASAADEKLRRCLTAIIHFNDYSATDKQQKWAINQSSLQRLSGCHRDAVKRFLVEHELLVNRHNSHHSLTERHNTGKGRAGLKIEQVIFW